MVLVKRERGCLNRCVFLRAEGLGAFRVFPYLVMLRAYFPQTDSVPTLSQAAALSLVYPQTLGEGRGSRPEGRESFLLRPRERGTQAAWRRLPIRAEGKQMTPDTGQGRREGSDADWIPLSAKGQL